jgi:hypothetical protein
VQLQQHGGLLRWAHHATISQNTRERHTCSAHPARADYGARVEVVYLEPHLPLIHQQNERRSKPVPAKVIQHLVDSLEPPTWTEAHSICLIGGAFTVQSQG